MVRQESFNFLFFSLHWHSTICSLNWSHNSLAGKCQNIRFSALFLEELDKSKWDQQYIILFYQQRNLYSKSEGSSESSDSPHWGRNRYMFTHCTEELVYSLFSSFHWRFKNLTKFLWLSQQNFSFFWYLIWLRIKPTSFHILFLVNEEKRRITHHGFLHSSYCYFTFPSKFTIYKLSI